MSKEYEDFIYPAFARRQKNKCVVLFEPVFKERLEPLLQRATPMKPYAVDYFKNNTSNGKCSNCHERTPLFSFCPFCGQALDRSKNNE